LFPVSLLADTVGKFSEIRGNVSLTREKATIKPKVDDGLQIKDLVSTGERARTKLLLGDDSMLSVGQNSKLEITQFLIERGKRTSILSLGAGTIAAVAVGAVAVAAGVAAATSGGGGGGVTPTHHH